MTFLDNLYIQKFHESKIEKFGSDNARSLAWNDQKSQQTRFDTLTQAGDFNNASILDIGCGNGDLCLYLSQRYSGFSYFGIDLMASFLDNAIEQTKSCSDTRFYLGDFMLVELPQVDYVLLSGSLNYKQSDPEFIFNAITKLFHQSNIAFGFNLLSGVLNPDGILTAYDPEQIVAFCRTLSPHVIFRDGYAENDYTVIMYKRVLL
ncbi:MAG: class I SAM-dependent methyltransferase [Bacteroidetes bacterium]|nr:class I SAM-dependent methyltransferase [Bacteroidota bacterium]